MASSFRPNVSTAMPTHSQLTARDLQLLYMQLQSVGFESQIEKLRNGTQRPDTRPNGSSTRKTTATEEMLRLSQHGTHLVGIETGRQRGLRPVQVPTHTYWPLPAGTKSKSDIEKGYQAYDPYGRGTSGIIEENEKIALPEKKYGRTLRAIRYTCFNVYRRLFSVVFMLNMIGLAILLASRYEKPIGETAYLGHLATGTSANILIAILIRQDYVVNFLFRSTWYIPLSAPLRLRRMLAKVYENGGVHSGAAVSSVFWFGIFTAEQTRLVAGNESPNLVIVLTSFILLSILVTLCITAYPKFRFKRHDIFENVHRWGGWCSLAIIWIQLCLFADSLSPTNLGHGLIELPAFWFLLISTLHAIYPWILLRRMQVRAEKLSDHAIRLHFSKAIPLFVGLRISRSPLTEWHSFAAIPARPDQPPGGSVLISNAGDWTNATVHNPASYYYVKGVPVTGVLCMARIFKPVIIVTTGSGIGPVLAVVQDLSRHSCRLIWSTPSPLKTYGREICGAVKQVDERAVIIDTRAPGQRRPDLVRMAYKLYKEESAEAVFVISNPFLTRKVVYGLESRGIPCFGPVWDS